MCYNNPLPPINALHQVAVDETFILLHLPLPLVGVSIVMERGCPQNDSLADGYHQGMIFYNSWFPTVDALLNPKANGPDGKPV